MMTMMRMMNMTSARMDDGEDADGATRKKAMTMMDDDDDD